MSHESDDDMEYDPSNVEFTEWLASKNFNYNTMKELWIYWARGDDEVEIINEESSDSEDEDEVANFFRIKTNVFDFETPLYRAFKEFNYLLQIDPNVLTKDIEGFKTYKDYKDYWIYEWNKDVPWVHEKPRMDDGAWKEPDPLVHYYGQPVAGGTMDIVMEETYLELTYKLKEEALKNKAILEGIIEDEDDESSNEGCRRWNPVCNIRRFEMIKYSFRQDEEYVAVKENEYDDATSISKDACRTYQEIFRMMDEGWMDLAGKEIDEVGGLDNSTGNVLIPLDSWTSGLLVYKLPLSGLRKKYRLNLKNDMPPRYKYGKIWYDEDVHDLRSVETEFPAIVFNDNLTSNETLFCEPTVSIRRILGNGYGVSTSCTVLGLTEDLTWTNAKLSEQALTVRDLHNELALERSKSQGYKNSADELRVEIALFIGSGVEGLVRKLLSSDEFYAALAHVASLGAKDDFDKALVGFPTTPFPFLGKVVAAVGGTLSDVARILPDKFARSSTSVFAVPFDVNEAPDQVPL
ncbi:hypothetical protein Tco_0485065 [Tanacetum coccineum]